MSEYLHFVDCLVLLHVGVDGELAIADIAFIGFLVRVNYHVSLEVGQLLSHS